MALPDAIFAKTVQITQVEGSIIQEQKEETELLKQWKTKYSLERDKEETWRKGKAVVVV